MEPSCRLGWARGFVEVCEAGPRAESFHTGRNSVAGEASGAELGCAKGVFSAGCLPCWQVRLYPGADRGWVCFVWETRVQMLLCMGEKPGGGGGEAVLPWVWVLVWAGRRPRVGAGFASYIGNFQAARWKKYPGAQPHFGAGLLQAGGSSGRSQGHPGSGRSLPTFLEFCS